MTHKIPETTPPQHGQSPMPQSATTDHWISAIDISLKTLFARPPSARINPGEALSQTSDTQLAPEQRKHSASLMRVNHVGEVCAQALYTAQSLTTHNPELRQHLKKAAQEEIDHLNWCRSRLDAFNTRASALTPLWYAGAFAIGLAAGKLGGDKTSLGFVAETEKQVEAHLASHLDQLPLEDTASRAIVKQMKIDEARHAHAAERAGGTPLPCPVKLAMKIAGKIMTTTARYI